MNLLETQPSLVVKDAKIPQFLVDSLNMYSSDIAFYYRRFAPETEGGDVISYDQFSLDSNPEKFISLASKQVEYLKGIARRLSNNPNLDSIASDPNLIKFLTLNFFLSHPVDSFDLSKLLHSFQNKFPNTAASEIWAEMGVIVDYIETGGKRCNGGNGFGPGSPNYERYSNQIKEALVFL